jgi:integrase
LTLGQKPLKDITADDVEAFRAARRAEGLSAVTVNHDLKLLRKMFNWAIRKRWLGRTPFRVDGVTVVSLDREIPRAVRFEQEEDEQKLLTAANPHLRALIVAMLDTACRPGELLSLQWKDVNLKRREFTVRAQKSKTRTGRIVPISTRLLATLELRKLDPAGRQPHKSDAYVFGNEVGERSKSVHTAWTNAAKRAGLKGLQLRDLRHEAGSRFDEAGVPINYVSKMLGHTNLTTTTRYLNIQRRGLHRAIETLEAHQSGVAQALHTAVEEAQAGVPPSEGTAPPKPLVS